MDSLEKTDLENSRVVNRWFLDYNGMPHWETSLHPWINILIMEEKWTVMPGDGMAKATFITTQDLGRSIGQVMDVPVWEKESTITGNETHLNNLLALVEKTRGWSNCDQCNLPGKSINSIRAANSKSLMAVLRNWTPARSLLAAGIIKSDLVAQ
jgi:hypothetical protein